MHVRAPQSLHGAGAARLSTSLAPILPAGDFLEPDEVTFAVLLRGYGAQEPPKWQQIDATLTAMKVQYSIDPSIREPWLGWRSGAGAWRPSRLSAARQSPLPACLPRLAESLSARSPPAHPSCYPPHPPTPTHTPPFAVSYNTLLEVCVRTNDMDRGLDVLDRMADDDVAPDDYTLEVVKRKRVLRSHIGKLFEL